MDLSVFSAIGIRSTQLRSLISDGVRDRARLDHHRRERSEVHRLLLQERVRSTTGTITPRSRKP